MVVCRASSKVGNWGACSGRSGPRARRRQCPNCVCAVCWGGAIRTPYPPAPQSPPPPHREWRCIGGGAATIAAAVTATVAATGTAALQQRRRGARHQPRRTAGGQATAVPASRALVVSLRRLPCPGELAVHAPRLFVALRAFFNGNRKWHMSAQYGCHLNHMVNTEGATWGVVRAFRLPNGASIRRLIRRAPLAAPKSGHRVQP